MVMNFLKILKDIMIAPERVFHRISSMPMKREVLTLFLVGAVFTFTKSFGAKAQRINFWADSRVNEILSFFSIPQIKWLIAYISFFLFLLIVNLFCKILFKKSKLTDLILYFMSISGAGVMLQFIFLFLPLFFSKEVTYLLSYVAFLWIVYLSVLSIKISQDTTLSKAMIIYFASALPVVVITGLPGISPFLMWIA